MLPAAAGDGATLLMLRLLPVDPCLLLLLAGLLGLPRLKAPGLGVPNSAVESMARKALMALLPPVLSDAPAVCRLPAAASGAPQPSKLHLAFLA